MFKSLSLVRRNFARMMCKDAINSALSQELERDPLVYLMGISCFYKISGEEVA